MLPAGSCADRYSIVDIASTDIVAGGSPMSNFSQQASHLPLSQAEFQILLAVSRRPRHGYAIMREVEDHCGPWAMPGPGTLYGAIKRLRQAGFIEEVESSSRRRPYRITRQGHLVAAAEAKRLGALVRWADVAGL